MPWVLTVLLCTVNKYTVTYLQNWTRYINLTKLNRFAEYWLKFSVSLVISMEKLRKESKRIVVMKHWNNNRVWKGVWEGGVFFCESGSSDPYLWLTDPTSFFSDFKDANFFILLLTRRHITFSLKNLIFCSNFVLKFYFASNISARSTPLWEKGRIWTWSRIRIRVHTSD